MKEALKEITINKDESPLIPVMSADITNGEIFLATRQIQDSALVQGVKISNLSEMYHWAIEQRDMMKEEA
jgi:hypothetical protein